MKKYPIILTSLLFIGLAFWLFLSNRETLSLPATRPGVSEAKSSDVGTGPASTAKQHKTEEEENAALEAASDAQRERELKEMHAQEQRQYSTAIVFYGVVQDLTGQPVPQAHVKYMNADPSGNWKWKDLSTTDTGSFTVSGVRGRYLDVQVNHPAYYEVAESRRSFTYAGNDRGPDFKPDPASPEIFRLRKKGEAAELIRDIEQILFNPDEKERSFSLYDHSRRRDQPDYVIIRFVDKGRINSRGKHVLDLELSTPGGGIQPRTDPFQFTAPTTGYQSSLIPPPDVGVNFKDYFVRFDSGNYGRFTISGNSGQYDVESFLNPDQSPNLEYDPAQEITFVRTGRMGIDLLYPASDDPSKPLPKSTPSKPVERPGGSLIERRRNAEPPPALPPAPPRG